MNATLPKELGGFDSEVILINSKDGFRPDAVVNIAKRLNIDPKKILQRIHVSLAVNVHNQILLADKANKLAKEKTVRLLIVNSISQHFREEYVGSGALAERQQTMNRHMWDLARFAKENNAAAVIINEATGSPQKPFCRSIISHHARFRPHLRKGKGDRCIIRLEDSPNLPEGEAVMRITEDGLTD